MSSDSSILSAIQDIEEVLIEKDVLHAFTKESLHFRVAFDLFREAASYVCVLGNITIDQKLTWNVGQAVLGGHLVRTFKLMRFAIEEAIDSRAELLAILTRLLTECVINIRFLIRNYSPELIRSYLEHSLHHEKELAQLIRSNIRERDGEELPIEARMLRSIKKTFDNSEISEDSLPVKKARNWGNKNLFEKARDVDLMHAYSAIFGGPSRNVHGSWQDLLQYHLNCESSGEFTPRFDFNVPRPQITYALTHLIVDTLVEYIAFLDHPSTQPIQDRLIRLSDRNRLASDLHEEYLVAKTSQPHA